MKKLQWKKISMYLPSVFFMVVIFIFSSQPAEESSAESSKIVHLLLYSLEYIRKIEFSSEEFLYWADRIHTPIRKIAHMTEYAVLVCTILIPALIQNREHLWGELAKEKTIWKYPFNKKILRKICLRSILVTMIYASTDEFHQLFVDGRSGEVKDVLIDTCGAVLGVFGILLLWKIRILIIRLKEDCR